MAELRHPDANHFEIVCQSDRGELHDRWESFAGLEANAWLRTLVYTNTSAASQDLTGATMRVMPVPADGGARWMPPTFWMADVTGGRVLDRDGRPAPGFEVSLRYPEQEGAREVTRSDEEGRFVFRLSMAHWYTVRTHSVFLTAAGPG